MDIQSWALTLAVLGWVLVASYSMRKVLGMLPLRASPASEAHRQFEERLGAARRWAVGGTGGGLLVSAMAFVLLRMMVGVRLDVGVVGSILIGSSVVLGSLLAGVLRHDA